MSLFLPPFHVFLESHECSSIMPFNGFLALLPDYGYHSYCLQDTFLIAMLMTHDTRCILGSYGLIIKRCCSVSVGMYVQDAPRRAWHGPVSASVWYGLVGIGSHTLIVLLRPYGARNVLCALQRSHVSNTNFWQWFKQFVAWHNLWHDRYIKIFSVENVLLNKFRLINLAVHREQSVYYSSLSNNSRTENTGYYKLFIIE
jgi:hypothetical protein